MSSFALSQILVGLALCTDILSFQFKERKQIICCLLVSCTLISTHFMLLHHWTAAGLGLVAAARFTTSLFSTSRYFMYFFIGITWVVSALTYEGLLSIIGGTASSLGTVGSFCKQDKQLRILILACTLLWILHNVLAGSPGAVVLECFFAGSNVVGYYRYYIRPQKQILTP
jgi:hypothetical protein